MTTRKRADDSPIIIKKYANRRLYNTASSAYVTLEDLRELVSKDIDFVVQDAKTGEDLTRAVLTQILAEAEQGGASLLPIGFLRQVIGMYGDGMSWMLPQYLECMTTWFEKHQQDMRRNMDSAFGGVFPVNASMDAMQDATRRNMAAFEQAMRAFWPGIGGAAETEAKVEEKQDGLDDLRRKLADMQTQIDALSTKGDK
ncbi:MAG: polyhydroxyalkanoate synthesis repressor PhaR [Alphaproteobacteria bacterium]